MKKIFIILFFALAIFFFVNNNGDKQAIDPNQIIIDVRTVQEFDAGHLDGALNIPYTEIRENIKNHVEDKNKKIVVYCRSGRRSGIAQNILQEMGYKSVVNAGAYSKLK